MADGKAFDPDKYLAKKPSFDPDAYLAKQKPDISASPLREGSSASHSYDPKKMAGEAEAAIQGFGTTATLGYLPQIQAGLEPVTDKLFSFFTGKDAAPDERSYVQRRDAHIDRGERLGQEHPTASMLGKGAGIGTSLLIPGAAAAKGSGLLAKMGLAGLMGAAYNPGDVKGEVSPIQPGPRLATGAASSVLPVIGKYGVTAAKEAGKAVTTGGLNPAYRILKWLGKKVANKGDDYLTKKIATPKAPKLPTPPPAPVKATPRAANLAKKLASGQEAKVSQRASNQGRKAITAIQKNVDKGKAAKKEVLQGKTVTVPTEELAKQGRFGKQLVKMASKKVTKPVTTTSRGAMGEKVHKTTTKTTYQAPEQITVSANKLDKLRGTASRKANVKRDIFQDKGKARSSEAKKISTYLSEQINKQHPKVAPINKQISKSVSTSKAVQKKLNKSPDAFFSSKKPDNIRLQSDLAKYSGKPVDKYARDRQLADSLTKHKKKQASWTEKTKKEKIKKEMTPKAEAPKPAKAKKSLPYKQEVKDSLHRALLEKKRRTK